MSNVSAAQVFAGIEDAEVSDRNPKLPAMGQYLLEVTNVELFDGNEGGTTFLIEHKILESDRPEVKIGAMYSTTITGLTGPDKKLKLGKVKNFVAAVFNKDENDAQFKAECMQAAVYIVERKVATGRRVRATTGEVRMAKKSGKPFISVSFSPA